MTRRPPPPRVYCQVHPASELVDISVPQRAENHGVMLIRNPPKLEQACRVCEPDLVLLDTTANLWGRPGDWPVAVPE